MPTWGHFACRFTAMGQPSGSVALVAQEISAS